MRPIWEFHFDRDRWGLGVELIVGNYRVQRDAHLNLHLGPFVVSVGVTVYR